MSNNSADYPQQFYGCPKKFNSAFEKNNFMAKIMTVIANELHSLRMEIKKWNETKATAAVAATSESVPPTPKASA